MTAPYSHRPSARRAPRANDGGKGNAGQRRARKRWLCETFGRMVKWPDDDGQFHIAHVVQCSMCSTLLTHVTVTADRWPIPGWKGGTYQHGNIRPACLSCNVSDGGKQGRGKQLELKPNQRACRYCGFVSSAALFVDMGRGRWRCKSGDRCGRRLRKLMKGNTNGD